MPNIAICDDTPMFRDKLERIIHQFEKVKEVEFGLFLFDSGEELIKKFDEDHFLIDIFFLDYFMKGLNGIQTAQYIRKVNSNCKMVFVTSAVSGNLYEFMQVSPLGILSKPANEDKVFQVLEKALTNDPKSDNDFSWPIM